ncbi:MAG TPA: hypothetical protein VL098_15470 [Flavipsychrobacter sp.]|nr:hypothetical protein [Flavipsychrobacter sp.]
MLKKLLPLFFSVVFCFNAYGQYNMENSLGLKFGESTAEAKSQVLAALKVSPEYTSSEALTYFDVLFAGRKTEKLQLNFHKDKLVSVSAVFSVADLDRVYSEYLNIVSELKDNYGEPTWSTWNVKVGYENEKDSNALNTALLIGNIMASNSWMIGEEKQKNTKVTIESGGNRKILLLYSNGEAES